MAVITVQGPQKSSQFWRRGQSAQGSKDRQSMNLELKNPKEKVILPVAKSISSIYKAQADKKI